MTNEFEWKKLGWKSLCDKGCHTPYRHSHDFELGKNIEKFCEICQQKMEIDAQVFGCEKNKHSAALYNVYLRKCSCPSLASNSDIYSLYDGQSDHLENIYKKLKDYFA